MGQIWGEGSFWLHDKLYEHSKDRNELHAILSWFCSVTALHIVNTKAQLPVLSDAMDCT